jgi:hypothetical protein
MYLHDVWVNWFEGEENPYLVPYFHEWRKDDGTELMDQIPLLQVNSNLYNYIVFGLNKLASDILQLIDNKAYSRNSNERIQEKYAFICTDGKGVMAIQLNQYGIVQKKSNLIPRQFQLVIEKIADDRGDDFELDNIIDVSDYKTYMGLTRMEKGALEKTTEFINSLLPEKLAMLKYIIAEWDLKLHKNLAASTFDEIKHSFLDEVKGSEISRLIEFNKVIDKLRVNN